VPGTILTHIRSVYVDIQLFADDSVDSWCIDLVFLIIFGVEVLVLVDEHPSSNLASPSSCHVFNAAAVHAFY